MSKTVSRIDTAYLPSGASTEFTELSVLAYKEFPEFRDRSLAVFETRMQAIIAEHTRVEIGYWSGAELVGGIVAGLQEDCHYGVCLVALLQYVKPEHRLPGVYRELFKVFVQAGKDTGVGHIMWTHRKGPGKYLTTYRRINGSS